MASTPGRRGRGYRYAAWHGGVDPLAAPFDVTAAVDELGEQMLEGRSARQALRDLLRRGVGGRRGLSELRSGLARRRRQLARRGDLAGILDQVRQRLDQVLAAEREALAAEPGDDARLAEMSLADLPADVGAAVRELDSYDWHSAEARAGFEAIKDLLRAEVLDAQFAGMRQALTGGDPAAMQEVRDMLADLNQLLAAHARGEDTDEAFEAFMARHGAFFPENPRSVDDLIDSLARRQAAAERMLRSLTPDQRAELSDLLAQALGDPDLESQLSQLRDNLGQLRPGMGSGGGVSMRGDQPLGYGEAVGAVADLADLEALERQLAQDYPGASLDDVDVASLERQLAPADVADFQQLRALEKELERQGYLSRDREGLALTPKALRRLGHSALKRIFARLESERRGDHDDHRPGVAEEQTGAFLPWEFGKERPIDAVRTVHNAVLRRAGAADADSERLLSVEDFEVAETERRTTAAVALLVDLSFSMYIEDRWRPMKQTALALSHLIMSRFRGDALQIIGFDRAARRLTPLELAAVEPTQVKGTNLQHALHIAARHLRRHPAAEPVVLVITDGEPTAHLQADGLPVFDYPPTVETIRATIAEVDGLTRAGVPLNFFLLGDDPGLARFVDAVARRNGGRVFTPEAGRLGDYVVADYLRARSRGARGRQPAQPRPARVLP